MNTGIQRSSATPWGAWTTTTPAGHPEAHPKKDIMAIMAAHRVPYAASAAVAYPEDLVAKAKRAKAIRGTRFLHVLAPCPPGWKINDEESIALGRMAVRTRAFPLVEVVNGEQWRITMDHPGDPIEPYLRRQGRFRHLSAEQVVAIQQQVDARWESLQRRVRGGEPAPA
jgi:pyruvate/2-oxoacid:ferredoxin oxidoreductase beta subunit